MKTLLASTVLEFFRQRAGLFLVAVFLLFGFLTSREHQAFALFFLRDAWGMPILFVLWSGYALLCAQFIRTQWMRPDYSFLYMVRLLSPPIRFFRLLSMALGFIQPLIGYSIYLFVIAIQAGTWQKSWPIPLFLLFFSLVLATGTEWRLRRPDVSTSARKMSVRLPFRRPASLVFWIFEWLFRERGLTVALTKIGALLFVQATLVYDSTGEYDIRLPAIGFVLAYLMNAGLSQELYDWESRVWLWGRNLPFSSWHRFLRVVLLHALLVLPETLIALRIGYSVVPWEEWLQIYGLGVSVLLLYHARMYRRDPSPERNGLSLMAGYFILTFIILYSVPIWLVSTVLFGAAGWTWQSKYST